MFVHNIKNLINFFLNFRKKFLFYKNYLRFYLTFEEILIYQGSDITCQIYGFFNLLEFVIETKK